MKREGRCRCDYLKIFLQEGIEINLCRRIAAIKKQRMVYSHDPEIDP